MVCIGGGGDISVMCVRGMYVCCVLGGGVTWCVFGRCTCFVCLEEGVASYDAPTCGVCFGGDVRQTNKQTTNTRVAYCKPHLAYG